jgi:DNA-binding MltR family transcriptional regulator
MPPQDHFQAITFEQFQVLFDELYNASDRVTAITCTALLDDMLGATLLTRFVLIGDSKETRKWKDRIFASANGPLSTFSSKIVIGYALGLYGSPTYADLDGIREIRNKFAHTPKPIHFTDEAIAKLCGKLKTVGVIHLGLSAPFPLDTGSKAKYANVVSGIAWRLRKLIEKSPARPSPPDDDFAMR